MVRNTTWTSNCFIYILQVLLHGMPKEIKLAKPFTEQYDREIKLVSSCIRRYNLERMGKEPRNCIKDQCYTAIHEAVDILINKYPNVSCISAAMVEPYGFMQKLILDLAVGYDTQLTKFVCSMPARFPYTLTAPNIIELDLRLYHFLEPNFPTISPRSLRKMNLVLENQLFSWDMFRVGNESEAIIFDNLVDLSITDTIGVLDTANEITANDLGLEFPKLERLYLENICLTRKTEQTMVGHRLKRLHCKGSVITVLQLCKQPLRDLDKLHLIRVKKPYPNEADYFIPLSNDIFNKIDGIEHVHFDIQSVFRTINMDGIDWPHLTHLSLEFMIPFKELLVMISNIPNLVRLDMDTSYFSVNEANESIKFLMNLKKYYPTPSSSKIKIMCLTNTHATFSPKSPFQLSVDRVIENLKRYWPQLKNIVNQGFSVLRRS